MGDTILYDKLVNWSVFDGEITLEKAARDRIKEELFAGAAGNKDIKLIIAGERYKARLMYVESSNSVQISYGMEVHDVFKKKFKYSYHFYLESRAEAARVHMSTRKIPTQQLERITIREVTPLLYKVEMVTCPYEEAVSLSEESITCAEGREKYELHRTHERNYGIVKLAKERFKELNGGKLFCEVCGFSFKEIYGEEYIEVHHTVPVAELGEYGVTKIEDLCMVCSNCHKVMHLTGLLTVEELKKKIER